MGLMKKVAFVGIAKKLYDESRKPHNKRKIDDAMASFKQRRTNKGGQRPR